MDQTPRLSLPFLLAGQAQKHITHNEALLLLDALAQPIVQSAGINAPPPTPLLGEAHVVGAAASGAWAGHTDEIALWSESGWRFLDPATGWQVYNSATRTLLVFDAVGWTPLVSLGAGLPQLGINATPDSNNRLAVSAAATLLTHAGGSHQLKLNKAGAPDTASVMFQTGWAGHAEMGLSGDNSFSLKVSPDGVAWLPAFTADSATGTLAVAAGVVPAGDNTVPLGTASARWSAIWSATGVIQTSDRRRKTDLAPCDLGLGFIEALLPMRYRYRDGDGAFHYGLVAQQVEEALGGRSFAGHVRSRDDEGSEQGLRYDSFVAPLIAAVKELSQRLRALEAVRS